MVARAQVDRRRHRPRVANYMARVEAEVLSQAQPTTFRRTCCNCCARRGAESSSRCLWIEGYAKRVYAVPPWSMTVWIHSSTTHDDRGREA